MFFNIIFNDIVPIFVVMALGYAGAKMNAFTPSQTQALNKVVLNFALPAALFVSITKATRAMLFNFCVEIRLLAVFDRKGRITNTRCQIH